MIKRTYKEDNSVVYILEQHERFIVNDKIGDIIGLLLSEGLGKRNFKKYEFLFLALAQTKYKDRLKSLEYTEFKDINENDITFLPHMDSDVIPDEQAIKEQETGFQPALEKFIKEHNFILKEEVI